MAREEALPYYKWLVKHWRSNRKVQRMGYIAKGLYRELLDEAWIEGSIPNDMSALADICDCPVDVMTEAWPRIVVCWLMNEHGRWVNEKLEAQRTEKDAHRVLCAQAGKLGGLVKMRKRMEAEDVSPEDIERVKQAETATKDSLAGAQQQLADAHYLVTAIDENQQDRAPFVANAKRTLANAKQTLSERHIEEKRREEKSKEKPSGKPGAESRHNAFHEQVNRYWKHVNGEEKALWDGSEGKALSALLAAKPDLTIEDFRRCLKHRGDSPDEVQTERPRQWLPNILRFAGGPLDRYGKPLQAAKPPSTQLRGVTLEEAMQR